MHPSAFDRHIFEVEVTKGRNGGSSKVLRHYLLRLRRALLSPCGIIGGLLIALALSYFYFTREEPHYITCLPNQPLVIVHQSFLPPDEFTWIRNSSLNDPLVRANELQADNFANTKGWVVHFNRDGLARLRANDSFDYALKYFDAIVKEESNAFVMNLLVALQPPRGKDAVKEHYDDTLSIAHPGEFLAHQVNVLYTKVPRFVKGGELEVWPWTEKETELNKAIVFPEENLMVEFRGDAMHKVRGFASPSRGHRVSLVVEQYRVRPEWYGLTEEYRFVDNSNDA